jgi:hypothetical protein
MTSMPQGSRQVDSKLYTYGKNGLNPQNLNLLFNLSKHLVSCDEFSPSKLGQGCGKAVAIRLLSTGFKARRDVFSFTRVDG